MLPDLHADGGWQRRVLYRPVCDLLGCRLPLVLAGKSGGEPAELVLQVSQAGGFAFLGMAREPASRIREEAARMRAAGAVRFGVGLIPSGTAPSLLAAQLDACIELKVPVLGLVGDVVPRFVEPAVDAGILVMQQVGSPADARQAEAAGARVLAVQGAEAGSHVRTGGASPPPLMQLLPEVLAAANVPVLAGGDVREGADVAALLALGAQGVMLDSALLPAMPESLARIADEAARMLRTAASEPPPIELSSPVCYAREFELAREDAIERPALVAALDELLEGARAAVRLSLPGSTVATEEGMDGTRLAQLHRDEVKWCGMLAAALLALGAVPSIRTGSFHAEAASLADPAARLAALLRRRQGPAADRLRALVPQVVDERLADGLSEMLAAYKKSV